MVATLSDREYRAQFYVAVDQRQAADQRQRRYYVPIYDRSELSHYDIVATLRDAIEFTPTESVHLLSGFRGSGKTSELMRLKDQLTEVGYRVVYMDIEDHFNTELPLESGALPIALAAGFASAVGAEQRQAVGERLRSFLARIRIEPTLGVDAAGLSAEVTARLRDDDSFRNQVAEAMRTNRRAAREAMHEFFRAVAADLTVDRGTVFLVDSIDHYRGRAETFHEVRDSVNRTFSELADELCLPMMHVVYTVPVYVRSPLGLRHDVLNIKVADPDGTPQPTPSP